MPARSAPTCINDTWAGADPELVDVAAELGAGFVCSHTGGAEPRTRPHRVAYDDVVADVVAETDSRRHRATVAHGVPREGVLIDPTHDFGKNTWHGLELLRRRRRARRHRMAGADGPVAARTSSARRSASRLRNGSRARSRPRRSRRLQARPCSAPTMSKPPDASWR